MWKRPARWPPARSAKQAAQIEQQRDYAFRWPWLASQKTGLEILARTYRRQRENSRWTSQAAEKCSGWANRPSEKTSTPSNWRPGTAWPNVLRT